MNNTMENVEMLKGYLQELREMILTMNNSDKGKASTNQDSFPSYSPPLRENFAPSITKTEEVVSEEEMTYGERREEEPIGGNRQDFQYHRIE